MAAAGRSAGRLVHEPWVAWQKDRATRTPQVDEEERDGVPFDRRSTDVRRPAACLALLCLALAAPAARAAEHPHLFYGPGDVDRLRAQAAGTHAAIAGSLRAGTDYFVASQVNASGVVTWSDGRTFDLGDPRDVGNGIAVWAFTWQLDGRASYLQLARTWLLDAAAFSSLDLDGQRDLTLAHLVTGVAIGYDILYPQLSDAERASVRTALANGANLLMQAGKAGAWWEHEYLQNHNWIDHAAVGLAALALEGEVAQATTDAWKAYAIANARTVKAVTDPIADGTWHEGLGYLGYGYMFHLPFVYALKRAGGEDLTELTILRADANVRAHAQVPDAPHVKVLTFADFTGFGKQEGILQLRFAASEYRDGVAQAVADRQLAKGARYTYGPESSDQIFEFLFYDPTVAATDLATLPLDWYGDDLQAVIFRSGWDEGALLFAMKCGPYGGRSTWSRIAAGVAEVQQLNLGHDHADDGGIYLYGNGSWLAPEAEGYFIGHPDSPPPEANRTIFHNALTVDGQGQLGEGVRYSGDGATSYSWYEARAGGIPFRASSHHNAYAIAEGGKLYPSALGLSRWDRHALFLGRKLVVLRDVVNASAAHDYHLVTHFMEGAVRDGSWIRGTGTNGQALGEAVIAPASFTFSATKQAPNQITGLNPNGYVWAAEVSPAAPAANVTFLTALVPVAQTSWAARPQVAALDTAAPDAGLTVTDGGRVSVALFDDLPTGARTAGGYRLAGLAGAAEWQDGALDRVLLVQASALERDGALLGSQDGTSLLLEADGLSGETVNLSGDKLGGAAFRAPRATRVLWYGLDVPFTRDGELIRIDISPVPAQPTPDQLPVVPPLDDPPPSPPDSAPGQGDVADAAGTAASAASGCSAGGRPVGAIALLGVAALLAVAVRRPRRRR